MGEEERICERENREESAVKVRGHQKTAGHSMALPAYESVSGALLQKKIESTSNPEIKPAKHSLSWGEFSPS